MYSCILFPHCFLPGSDSGSLLKIQNAIHSYKRLIQLKTGHCKVLLEKLQTVENEVNGLRKKLADAAREQLQQGQELCNVRYDVSSLSKMPGSYRDSLVVETLASGGGGSWILSPVLHPGVTVVCAIPVLAGQRKIQGRRQSGIHGETLKKKG